MGRAGHGHHRRGRARSGSTTVTGSLEPGKRADIVTVSLDGLHTTPVLHGADFNVAAHLVFSASGRDVRDVWVDGRARWSRRTPADVRRGVACAPQAQAAAEELFERRAKVLEAGT